MPLVAKVDDFAVRLLRRLLHEVHHSSLSPPTSLINLIWKVVEVEGFMVVMCVKILHKKKNVRPANTEENRADEFFRNLSAHFSAQARP